MAEQMFRVTNPLEREIEVQWDGIGYPLEGGESRVLPEPVALQFRRYFPEVQLKRVEARYEEAVDPAREKFINPNTGREFQTMTELQEHLEAEAERGVRYAAKQAAQAEGGTAPPAGR